MPFPTAFVYTYPETDLLHYHTHHGKRIPLLSPMQDIPKPTWSDNFKKAARIEAELTGLNPVRHAFGLSLFQPECEDLDLDKRALKVEPQVVPPIKQISPPRSITFLESLNATGDTPMYTVLLDGDRNKIRLLKFFRDDAPDPSSMSKSEIFSYYQSGANNDTTKGWSRVAFDREIAAYARLEYHGVAKAGIVPRCYGWFTVDRSSPGLPQEIIDNSDEDQLPPRAIVLEFFSDVERVSSRTASIETAKKALEAIWTVHRAFVQHNDIHQRNVLIDRSGRIKIVDFDVALVANDPYSEPNRASMMAELGEMWKLFFNFLIPNSYIGWDEGDRDGI